MSTNAPGSVVAVEYSKGGTKPTRGKPCSRAFWIQRAIMPATRGVAALVPPTMASDCIGCGPGRQPWTIGEQTIAYPGFASANADTSGTRRALARADDAAGCHHGRVASRLCPPPPAARALYGAGKDVSFQTPVAAMLLSGLRVRFVPPTASTQGELAGQDTCGVLSAAVRCLVGTARGHVEDPLSPAATTTVMPRLA